MIRQIITNHLYRHYKGNIYKTHLIGTYTGTSQEMVVYECVKNKRIFIRSLDNFAEILYVDGKPISRFQLIPQVHYHIRQK